MQSQKIMMMSPDDAPTPAASFVLVNAEKLLSVLLNCSNAAEIRLEIEVSGYKDGVQVLWLGTDPNDEG